MSHTAEISRTNPACILFLIDQSGSMADPFGSGDGQAKKADGVADAVNKLLQNLCLRCSKDEGIRDWFHVGVIGYGGAGVSPAFGSILAGRELVPISEIAMNPARVEKRTRKVSDGAGGLVDQEIKFPVWFDPMANGGTPMLEALREAKRIAEGWVVRYPDGFPPVVINVTDGEAEGDLLAEAAALRAVASKDGGTLLFNLHLSSKRAATFEFPNADAGLPDEYAKLLFAMSSPLPANMLAAARQEGYAAADGARGFAFNADLVATIKFLDIGTRPSNVR